MFFSQRLIWKPRFFQSKAIATPFGVFTVTWDGNPGDLPVMVTLHDIGLNHHSNFGEFLKYPQASAFTVNYCIIHVDLPGQESGAETLASLSTNPYPSIDQLCEGLKIVLAECGADATPFIGFGYGAGAFVMSSFALSNPKSVRGLILFNATSEAASYMDSVYQRQYANLMSCSGFISRPVRAYFQWYHFGREEEESADLIEEFDSHLCRQNPKNLAGWMRSFNRRSPLKLQTPLSSERQEGNHNFQCPVCLIVGKKSPHLEQTRKMFSQCDPNTTYLYELNNCRAPLQENPLEVRILMTFFFCFCSFTFSRWCRIILYYDLPKFPYFRFFNQWTPFWQLLV